MASIAEKADRLERLEHDLRLARGPATSLFARVIADACTRIPALRSSRTRRGRGIDRLVAAGAWTDAAFAVIALSNPPAWQIRRLWRQESAWFCSLSQRAAWPAALDDTADAAHKELPLACAGPAASAPPVGAGSGLRIGEFHRVQQAADGTVCCDNFASNKLAPGCLVGTMPPL